jgi:GMP synthase-like glutamine amidotransferase
MPVPRQLLRTADMSQQTPSAATGHDPPPALQKIIQELRHTARHGTLALVGCLGSKEMADAAGGGVYCGARERSHVTIGVRAQQGPLRIDVVHSA